MNYIVVPFRQAGEYIPKHDPSYVHAVIADAIREADYDLSHGATKQAIYKLDTVVP